MNQTSVPSCVGHTSEKANNGAHLHAGTHSIESRDTQKMTSGGSSQSILEGQVSVIYRGEKHTANLGSWYWGVYIVGKMLAIRSKGLSLDLRHPHKR